MRLDVFCFPPSEKSGLNELPQRMRSRPAHELLGLLELRVQKPDQLPRIGAETPVIATLRGSGPPPTPAPALRNRAKCRRVEAGRRGRRPTGSPP